MNSKTLRRAAGMAAILAGGILSGGVNTVLAQVVLPTGATITPNAAPGSVFERLKVDLPDYTNYSPDSPRDPRVPPHLPRPEQYSRNAFVFHRSYWP